MNTVTLAANRSQRSYNWVARLLNEVLPSELQMGARLLKAVLQSDSHGHGAAQPPRCDS